MTGSVPFEGGADERKSGLLSTNTRGPNVCDRIPQNLFDRPKPSVLLGFSITLTVFVKLAGHECPPLRRADCQSGF